MKNILSGLIVVITLSGFAYSQSTPLKREFRGAWVATVANIDWPSSKYASSSEQITELVNIFDKLEKAGINVVLFQVRTECDALYDSPIEPWSYWLTGEQGTAPSPYYDPLKFAISEAHNRGMELHAWLNPYRVTKNKGEYKLSPQHIAKRHPEWILDFGNYTMLNPGLPEVKSYIVSVVGDILHRYAVDGIHFDDYFYPYEPEVSNEDLKTFRKYGSSFNSIDDWRRNNINSMVEEVHNAINKINPDVKFGISPFGIVLNKYAGTNGFNSYDVLYCDPLTWIKDKTVDYVTPQIYWNIGHRLADYSKLLPWWNSVADDVQLYIGMFSSRFTGTDWDGKPSEIYNQLRLNRKYSNVSGEVFFSAKSIFNDWSGFADSLKNNFYKYPALVPVMKWKDNIPPNPPLNPVVNSDAEGIKLSWQLPPAAEDGDYPAYYVIYKFDLNEKIDLNNPANIIYITKNSKTSFEEMIPVERQKNCKYVITSVDKLHNESRVYAVVNFEPGQ